MRGEEEAAIKKVGEIKEMEDRKCNSTRKNKGSRGQVGKKKRVGAKWITEVREREGRAEEGRGKEMDFRR